MSRWSLRVSLVLFFFFWGGGGRGAGFREGLGFRVLGVRAGPLQLLKQDTLLLFGVVTTVNRVLGMYYSVTVQKAI